METAPPGATTSQTHSPEGSTATPDWVTPRPTQPEANEKTILSKTMISPDGAWIADQRSQPSTGTDTFSISAVEGSQTWTLLERDAVHLGDYLISFWGWSADSRRFYYQRVWPGEAGEGNCEFFGIQGDLRLYCFDTQTRQTEEIPLPEGTDHSISPDERLFAYIRRGEDLRLVLRDRETWGERTPPLHIKHPGIQTEQSGAGRIVWSPDAQHLVLTLADYVPCGGVTVSALLQVDLEDLKVTELLRDEKGMIVAETWSEDGRILVVNRGGETWWVEEKP
jgi:hypothetical protein